MSDETTEKEVVERHVIHNSTDIFNLTENIADMEDILQEEEDRVQKLRSEISDMKCLAQDMQDTYDYFDPIRKKYFPDAVLCVKYSNDDVEYGGSIEYVGKEKAKYFGVTVEDRRKGGNYPGLPDFERWPVSRIQDGKFIMVSRKASKQDISPYTEEGMMDAIHSQSGDFAENDEHVISWFGSWSEYEAHIPAETKRIDCVMVSDPKYPELIGFGGTQDEAIKDLIGKRQEAGMNVSPILKEEYEKAYEAQDYESDKLDTEKVA